MPSATNHWFHIMKMTQLDLHSCEATASRLNTITSFTLTGLESTGNSIRSHWTEECHNMQIELLVIGIMQLNICLNIVIFRFAHFFHAMQSTSEQWFLFCWFFLFIIDDILFMLSFEKFDSNKRREESSMAIIYCQKNLKDYSFNNNSIMPKR